MDGMDWMDEVDGRTRGASLKVGRGRKKQGGRDGWAWAAGVVGEGAWTGWTVWTGWTRWTGEAGGRGGRGGQA